MNIEWMSLQRNNAIETCKKWITWEVPTYSLSRIIKYVDSLSVLVSKLLPNAPSRNAYASSAISIMIDDILEMDSINDIEKEQEIRQMIEDDKEELQLLAQKVIDQIEINVQEYLKSIEGRGFEEETFRRIRGDKEEWE